MSTARAMALHWTEAIIVIGSKMKSMTRLHSGRQAGFTLFELLTVMMIMSILAAIAIPSYKRSQIKASESDFPVIH